METKYWYWKMGLRDTDDVIIPYEALEKIEQADDKSGPLLHFEVIEVFFEWLKEQPPEVIVGFLREALNK